MQTYLGIIGGSGLYDMLGLDNPKWVEVKSPWGTPSDAVLTGTLHGLPIAFLPRHGRGHVYSPTTVPYRANIDALKRLGVTDVVSMSACGSFHEELAPGDFVVVDQFIDRTFAREKSFFGTGCVAHVSVAHPTCPRLSKAALEAGASVHLIAGPVHLPTPLEFTGMIRRTDVLSAADMANAVESAKDCDIFFSVAAVADWKIINPSTHKIKKSDSTSPPLEFALNPDILARMAANSAQRPFCVGFAAETQHVSEFGQAKRIAKNVPLLIANHGPDTFGQDHNQVSLIDANGVYPLQQMDKLNLAREIIAQVVQRLPA